MVVGNQRPTMPPDDGDEGDERDGGDEGGGVETEVLLEPLKRVEAFERLRDGAATRGELQAELDVSRATLHRIATFLREEGLAVETDDGLELTPVGQEVADAATAYAERVAAARRLAPLLNEVEPGALPVPVGPELLADADVVLPQPGHPGRPARRVVAAAEDAEWVRALVPVLLPIYVEAFHREITAGMEAKLVFEPDVLDGLDETYTDKFQDALETGRLDVTVHETLPFGLYLTPEVAGVVGYDDDDVLRIVVEGDDEPLRSWAEETYEHYRSEAAEL